MAETIKPQQEKKPIRHLWIKILAGFLALVMLLSLFALDAARIKLGNDAKTEAERLSAETLAENSGYINASTTEQLSQWLDSLLRSPETYEDYYQIATVLIAQGAYERALTNINASIRLYDGSDAAVLDELYMKQGGLYAMLGDYAKMEESFSHVSETSGYQTQKLLLIAQAAIEQSDMKKAIAYLEQYLALVPGDADMRTTLGQLYVAAAEYEKAAAIYTAVIDASGDSDGTAHFLRGSCNMEIQEYAQALADFREALSLGYADTSLCNAQCALCSFLCGAYEDCLTYGEAALADPSELVSQPDLHYYMGLAAMTLGDYETAYAKLSEALALDASRQDADYYATVCLMAMGRQDEAIARFTACIEQGYALSLCHYNRAVCYIQKRAYDLAKADLEQVIAIGDDAELVTTAQELLGKL